MSSDKLRVAFGSVVNVKAIPTREVTRVEIELPIEFHAELTRLLFGRDALVLPSNLPDGVNYGVMDSPETTASHEQQQAGESTERQISRSPSAISRVAGRAPGGTVQRGAPSLDIVRWLGMRCGESSFQAFLKASSREGAAQAVRDICGVVSRSEIPGNTTARSMFYQHIYHPFQRYLTQEAGRRHGFDA
jgi:hypothetical protein